MSNAFLGQIMMFAGNYPPRATAFCNGQLLPINQNQALFSLLGTTYGGNGQTTFALPNLQSQLPIHQGQGAGLSAYTLGQTAGSSAVTINPNTMPAHNHSFNATTANASAAAIANDRLPGKATVANGFAYAVSQAPPNPAFVTQVLAGNSCGLTGGSQPHSNLMPTLCITFVIFLQGIFPSRN
jgi:microcystin-dependent protein